MIAQSKTLSFTRSQPAQTKRTKETKLRIILITLQLTLIAFLLSTTEGFVEGRLQMATTDSDSYDPLDPYPSKDRPVPDSDNEREERRQMMEELEEKDKQRTENWVAESMSRSSMTRRGQGQGDEREGEGASGRGSASAVSIGGRGHGSVSVTASALSASGQEDAIRKNFEQKVSQLFTEYKNSLVACSDSVIAAEAEKNAATVEDLNKLITESVAMEKDTAKALKKKSAEVKELSNQKRHDTQLIEQLRAKEKSFEEERKKLEKEIALLKKQLKEKAELQALTAGENNALRAKLEEKESRSRSKRSPHKREKENDEMLSKISQSVEGMRQEIVSLKKQVVEAKSGVERETFEIETNSVCDTIKVPETTVELHRYFNKTKVDHYYTTDWDYLKDGRSNYLYEGVVGRVFPSSTEGTVPLFIYSSRKDGDHLYSINRLGAKVGNYAFKGILCYVYPCRFDGTKPLLRYYNAKAKDHFFTTNWEELGEGKDGYKSEGCAGFIY